MVKIINEINLPEKELPSYILSAAKALQKTACPRLETNKVVVVIRGARKHFGIRGYCQYTPTNNCNIRSKNYFTNGAYIVLLLPPYKLVVSRSIQYRLLQFSIGWEVLRHEWGHVYDDQCRNRGEKVIMSKGHRKAWEKRPEEIRVEHYCKQANLAGYNAKQSRKHFIILAKEEINSFTKEKIK